MEHIQIHATQLWEIQVGSAFKENLIVRIRGEWICDIMILHYVIQSNDYGGNVREFLDGNKY